MATNANTTPAAKTPKATKAPVKLTDRIKGQVNAAALKGRITVDDIQDLTAHLTKVAGLLGA